MSIAQAMMNVEAVAKMSAELDAAYERIAELEAENARLRVDTIEECAKVADAVDFGQTKNFVAAAIRSLYAIPIDTGKCRPTQTECEVCHNNGERCLQYRIDAAMQGHSSPTLGGPTADAAPSCEQPS